MNEMSDECFVIHFFGRDQLITKLCGISRIKGKNQRV